MKKKILFSVICVLLVTSSFVIADNAGEPNKRACFGQDLSVIAHYGEVGDWFRHEGRNKNTDFNKDGKINGQDLAWFVDMYKDAHCRD